MRCAGQKSPPVQRATASPSSLAMAEPHSGHYAGIRNSSSAARGPGFATRATSGITSPARRTTTVSRRQTSFRRTSSSLCNVAFDTVVPPANTGESRATYVMAPVRPTWTPMSRSSVVVSSAGNLCATAQRGARATNPSASCCASASTL